jgi:hypothetical protein
MAASSYVLLARISLFKTEHYYKSILEIFSWYYCSSEGWLNLFLEYINGKLFEPWFKEKRWVPKDINRYSSFKAVCVQTATFEMPTMMGL